MAELVSTLRISGSVNGKKINFTHTYTLEDVYDAGVHDMEDAAVTTAYNGATVGAAAITFQQNSPNYLLAANKDTVGVSGLIITATGGDVIASLPPQCFLCLTATQGMTTGAATITEIADEDILKVEHNPVSNIWRGKVSLLVAFNSTT